MPFKEQLLLAKFKTNVGNKGRFKNVSPLFKAYEAVVAWVKVAQPSRQKHSLGLHICSSVLTSKE